MHRYTLRVSHKQQLADQLFLVRLDLPSDAQLSFLAGQFFSIAVEGFVRRSYSILNAPAVSGYVETIVDTAPGGPGSRFFEKVEIGESVDALLPLGQFVYNPGRHPALFVATGTGIVPIMSMLQHELETLDSKRPLQLLYGVRHESRIAVETVLRSWQQKYPNFSVEIWVSKPTSWSGRIGRVGQDLLQFVQPGAEIYLCGGGQMIADLREVLQNSEKEIGDINHERFY